MQTPAVTPTVLPRISNELLIPPEDKISELQWEAWKYEIYAIISLVVFTVLCIAALWWACFYSVESLPVVSLGAGYLLYVVHTNFFHPWRQEAQKYWNKITFENRVIEELTELARRGQPNALLVARHNVHCMQMEQNARIVREMFEQPSNLYAENRDRDYNYQALLQWYQDPRTQPQKRESLHLQLATYEAIRHKIVEESQIHLIKALFCQYVAENPQHHGSLERMGTFLNRDVTSQMLAVMYRGENASIFMFANGDTLNKSQLNNDQTTKAIVFAAFAAH